MSTAPEFIYVTYIETTPEKLWEALTNSEFSKRYWFGTELQSDWKVGSPFALVMQRHHHRRRRNPRSRSAAAAVLYFPAPHDRGRPQGAADQGGVQYSSRTAIW